MIIFFPTPPSNSVFLTQVLDTIRRAFLSVVSKDEAVERIMLRSPNGTVYEVTVSDTGTLQTAINDGKSRL